MASAINHLQWFGLIESKIRYFVLNVEKEDTLESARIWPKPFTKKTEKTHVTTQLWFIGLSFRDIEAVDINR
jgi:poly(A) polymerase